MGQLKHGLNRYEIYLFRTRIYTRICFVFFIKERPCSYKWVLNFQAKQKGTSPPPPVCHLEFTCHAVMNTGCICAYRRSLA